MRPTIYVFVKLDVKKNARCVYGVCEVVVVSNEEAGG
jgi:hypothetical protein